MRHRDPLCEKPETTYSNGQPLSRDMGSERKLLYPSEKGSRQKEVQRGNISLADPDDPGIDDHMALQTSRYWTSSAVAESWSKLRYELYN